MHWNMEVMYQILGETAMKEWAVYGWESVQEYTLFNQS